MGEGRILTPCQPSRLAPASDLDLLYDTLRMSDGTFWGRIVRDELRLLFPDQHSLDSVTPRFLLLLPLAHGGTDCPRVYELGVPLGG